VSLSETARRGVVAAATFDPVLASQLLGILKTSPEAVKRKPGDTYGPRGFIFAGSPVRPLTTGLVFSAMPEPLGRKVLGQRLVFNDEWLSGACTRDDLADAITEALADLAIRFPAWWPEDVAIYQRRTGQTSE